MTVKRQAFTLIELLVVISIIALLVGILLPALGAARNSALDLKCKTQLRQFGISFMAYATDNRDTLPSNRPNTSSPTASKKTWLTEGTSPFLALRNAPEEGTIFSYVGEAAELYRCPALDDGDPALFGRVKPPATTSFYGSNGSFDYSTFTSWNNARVEQIRNQSTIARVPSDTASHVDVLTPLMIEEDPQFAINNGHPDSQHAFDDKVGRWHNGDKGNFTAIDGSTASFEGDGESDSYPEAQQWYSLAPDGKRRSLGNAQRSLDGRPASATSVEFDFGEWGWTKRPSR